MFVGCAMEARGAGHSWVVTVLDRYEHLPPGAADRVNAALDEIAASAHPAPDAAVFRMHRGIPTRDRV
jgi:hypothetical protein